MNAKARTDVDYLGRQVDEGQVVEVDDTKDEVFQRMGIFTKNNASTKRFTCNRCGAEFTTTAARDSHGARRHAR